MRILISSSFNVILLLPKRFASEKWAKLWNIVNFSANDATNISKSHTKRQDRLMNHKTIHFMHFNISSAIRVQHLYLNIKKNAQRDLVVAIIYFSPKRHQLNFFLIVEFFISFGVNSFFFNSLWSLCRESCRSSFNQGGNYWIFQRIVTQWETLTRKSVSFVEGNYKRLIRLLQSQPLDPVKRYCKIIFSGIILLNFTTLLYRIF